MRRDVFDQLYEFKRREGLSSWDEVLERLLTQRKCGVMNRELVDKVVHAVLYEGYILYPYRASSKKNQRERFTFGRVYPGQYSAAQSDREPCSMQTECLVRNESHDVSLEINVRFLQPLARGQVSRSG
jgi:hypothetical protein